MNTKNMELRKVEPEAIAIPRLPDSTQLECENCYRVIEKAPYYIKIDNAGYVCASCKDELELFTEE